MRLSFLDAWTDRSTAPFGWLVTGSSAAQPILRKPDEMRMSAAAAPPELLSRQVLGRRSRQAG
jgi:hypothetical protein